MPDIILSVFVWMITLKPFEPTKWVVYYSHFTNNQTGNRSSERLSNLLNVTKLVNGKGQIQNQVT